MAAQSQGFDQALVAIVHALMWFRPARGHNDPVFFYSSVVEGLISDIRAADPSLFSSQHALAGLVACGPARSPEPCRQKKGRLTVS
jgi:hypothetical protein